MTDASETGDAPNDPPGHDPPEPVRIPQVTVHEPSQSGKPQKADDIKLFFLSVKPPTAPKDSKPTHRVCKLCK
jgi:hypothetical protein